MPKNIVVCCDGTGNEFGESNSNVVKLYKMLLHDDSQVSYYHPGSEQWELGMHLPVSVSGGPMGQIIARGWLIRVYLGRDHVGVQA
jgi:type VI secretion system (T6SS) phospholipase Tle1-like effector